MSDRLLEENRIEAGAKAMFDYEGQGVAWGRDWANCPREIVASYRNRARTALAAADMVVATQLDTREVHNASSQEAGSGRDER